MSVCLLCVVERERSPVVASELLQKDAREENKNQEKKRREQQQLSQQRGECRRSSYREVEWCVELEEGLESKTPWCRCSSLGVLSARGVQVFKSSSS